MDDKFNVGSVLVNASLFLHGGLSTASTRVGGDRLPSRSFQKNFSNQQEMVKHVSDLGRRSQGSRARLVDNYFMTEPARSLHFILTCDCDKVTW